MKPLNNTHIVFFIFCLHVLKSHSQPVTFSQHIAPIIYKNCTSCHRPEGGAPFSFITYKDVSSRARLIKLVTENGTMPPWKADTTYQRFLDERILNKNEIALIKNWVENGAPQGSSDMMPQLPDFSLQQNFGKPDLFLRMAKPFKISGNNTDTFPQFNIPISLLNDTDVAAVEFIPGNRNVVHHMNLLIFPTDAEHTLPNGRTPVIYPYPYNKMLFYSGWLPGSRTIIWPEGIGFRLPKIGALIVNAHYAPTPIDQTDQSSCNIYYSKKTVTRYLEFINLGSFGGRVEVEPPLVIPPDSVCSFKIETEVPEDVSLLYFIPHMHYIGKKYFAYAIKPSGDTLRIVKIDDWDFNWQEFYKFPHPVKLPAGTKIVINGTFDNTVNNLKNPNKKPALIKEGIKTSDEMLSLVIMVVKYEEGDEKIDLDIKKVK